MQGFLKQHIGKLITLLIREREKRVFLFYLKTTECRGKKMPCRAKILRVPEVREIELPLPSWMSA